MQNLTRLVAIALAIEVLAGCARYSDRPVVGGPDAEEAAIRLEESKREYYDCLENSGPGQPTCDSIKALYEKDKDAYEATAR